MYEGWICQRCRRVNAPWVPQCPCDAHGVSGEIDDGPWPVFDDAGEPAPTTTTPPLFGALP